MEPPLIEMADSWHAGWNRLYQDGGWGRYPAEDLIRFVATNFGRVPDRAALRILEIGCGPGPNLWYVAREGFGACGLDGSQVALDQARALLAADCLAAELDLGDATRLPYEANTFDAAFEIECYSALAFSDAKRAAQEAWRVLKPGGLFYSKTLARGTTGDGTGEAVAGECNTYRNIRSAALRRSFGIHRFTAEKDIGEIYRAFGDVGYEHASMTRGGRTSVVNQWQITCRKI